MLSNVNTVLAVILRQITLCSFIHCGPLKKIFFFFFPVSMFSITASVTPLREVKWWWGGWACHQYFQSWQQWKDSLDCQDHGNKCVVCLGPQNKIGADHLHLWVRWKIAHVVIVPTFMSPASCRLSWGRSTSSYWRNAGLCCGSPAGS